MAVRRFSNSSQKVIKFPNIICVILVISHWRCLLITPSDTENITLVGMAKLGKVIEYKET